MIEPRSSDCARPAGGEVRDLLARRERRRCAASLADPVVRLHQGADDELPRVRLDPARRRPDAALEPVRDHPGPAADVAFLDRARLGRVQRGEGMLARDVKAVDVVEVAVVGLGDDRQCPEDVRLVRQRLEVAVLDLPFDDRVAHDADGVRVGQHDRPLEKAGLVIQVVPVISPLPFSECQPAKTGSYLRPRGRMAVTPVRRAPCRRCSVPSPLISVDVPDFDAGDIGDRVQRPGRAVERNPQVARADGDVRRACGERAKGQQANDQCDAAIHHET